MTREILIDKLSQILTDNADMDSLMEYFYNGQVEYFNTLSDIELEEQANNIMDMEWIMNKDTDKVVVGWYFEFEHYNDGYINYHKSKVVLNPSNSIAYNILMEKYNVIGIIYEEEVYLDEIV